MSGFFGPVGRMVLSALDVEGEIIGAFPLGIYLNV